MKTTDVEAAFTEALYSRGADSSKPSVPAAWSAFKELAFSTFECQRVSAFFEAGSSKFSGSYFQFVLVFKHKNSEQEWSEQFHVEFSEPENWQPESIGLFSVEFGSMPVFISAVEQSSAFVQAAAVNFGRFSAFHTEV